MSHNLWISLANNAALLLALFVIYETSYLITQKEKRRKILSGVLFSAICIAIMSMPFHLAPGVIFDTRTILLSVTAMVFGAIPAVITVAIASIYRILIGGVGTITGVATIVSSSIIGLIWRKRFLKEGESQRWITALVMSLLVHLAMLLCMFFLPHPQSINTIREIALPVMLIYPITSVILSILLVHQKERISLQNMLKESESKFRNIVENVSDVVWTSDLNLKLSYVSPSISAFLGISPEEYITKSPEERFPPDSIDEIFELIQNYSNLTKDGSFSITELEEIEVRHFSKNGETVWVALKISFLYDKKSKLTGLQCGMRDITARKNAEKALQNEMGKAQTYLEVARVIFIAIDRNMKIILINQVGCETLGVKKSDVIGKDWVENYIPARNKEKFYNWIKQIFESNNKESDAYTVPVVNFHGEERIISWRMAAIKDSGSLTTSILASGIDITEQERTLEALEESERSKAVFISHLPGIAYRCNYDKNWTMKFISQGCIALTGYQPEDMIDNRKLSYNDLISNDYRDEVWNDWEKAIKGKKPYRGEYEITTATGDKKWVLEMGQAIYGEQEQVLALEGIVIDIDESKKRFMQIQYMNDHDFLTGLYNRSYFEAIKSELDEKNNLPISIVIADTNGLKLINDAFGHAMGDQLIINAANALSECLPSSAVIARTGGDEFSVVLPKTSLDQTREFLECIEKKYKAKTNKAIRETGIINLSIGCAVKTDIEKSIEEVEKEAEDNMYRHKLLDRESHHNAIIKSVMATMFARSNETEKHAERLADLSMKLGEKLSLPQKSLDNLKLLSMLHDIGKVGIDDRILNKQGPLNEDEWDIMKKHPEIGYRIAMSSTELTPIAKHILHHHERWDGKGYPAGIKGEEISLLARILTIADAYDAMTNDRVYRKALTKKEAIKELEINAGSQFDPELTRLFIEIIN